MYQFWRPVHRGYTSHRRGGAPYHWIRHRSITDWGSLPLSHDRPWAYPLPGACQALCGGEQWEGGALGIELGLSQRPGPGPGRGGKMGAQISASRGVCQADVSGAERARGTFEETFWAERGWGKCEDLWAERRRVTGKSRGRIKSQSRVNGRGRGTCKTRGRHEGRGRGRGRGGGRGRGRGGCASAL